MATFATAIAILTFLLSSSSYCLLTSAESQAPALFIFGDSIVDCGNNDYLPNSTAVADYLPYGMDFFAVTGRFSNARNLADCVAERLGFEHLIACSRDPNSTGERILTGVNYASAGTGILDNSTAGVSNENQLAFLLRELLIFRLFWDPVQLYHKILSLCFYFAISTI